MSVAHTKTGATRHRVVSRWFGTPLLVLQIEIHAKGYATLGPDDAGPESVDYMYWRDAQVQDITEGTQ